MGRIRGHRYGRTNADSGPRPRCACGAPVHRKRDNRSGYSYWERHCSACRTNQRTYRKHLGTCCAHCGFVALHPSQYDVDHIDGNHANNDPSNLQTLCANCHRLKTVLAGDAQRWRERIQPPVLVSDADVLGTFRGGSLPLFEGMA